MNSDEFLEKAELIKNKLWKVEKKLIRALTSLAGSFISYGIALYVYLWVYDNYGWERTLIAIGVGFIVFSLRSRVNNA